MPLKKEWNYKEYISLDENVERPSYASELQFYEEVKNGEVEKLEIGTKVNPFSLREDWGILSENPLRNLIYHFVITVALIARVCIEGGLDVDEAYSLSDYYIQKADKVRSSIEIEKIHSRMLIDYSTRMKALQKKSYSKPISKCIDFIYNHLNENISVEDIAEYIRLSRSYISTLFKQETSFSINEYITRKKIKTAENMLKYSDYDILEISNILGFSSQSYFTKMFKQYTSYTPKKYKSINHEILSKKPL